MPPISFSHLQTQRLTEELASAQKRLKEYEYLITELYQNACEHCKASFQRITGPGVSPVLESSVCAGAATVVISPTSDGNGSHRASSSSNKPLWYRIFKRPRIPLPGSVSGQHSPATSRAISVPEPGTSLGGASHHDISAEQIQTFAESSDPHSSFVKFPDPVGKPTLKVNLERVLSHRGVIHSVKFSPDGKHLAVGVANGLVNSQRTYIYDVMNGRKVCLLADRYAKPGVPSGRYLSFSPGDGRYLATGHSTGQTMIWQVGKKHVRNAFGRGNTSVEFSSDGRFVVSSSYKSGVCIWSMRDGSSILLQDHAGEAFRTGNVKFSPDGKHVVASDFRGMLRLWNVRTSKLVRKWKAQEGTGWGLEFTPNGRGLVTGNLDHTLQYWDLDPPGDLRGVKDLKFVGHTTYIRSLAISPDGRWVISGSDDCTACIWDMVDASLRCTLLGHEEEVRSVDFSPTGNYVACGSWDGKVSLWGYKSSGG